MSKHSGNYTEFVDKEIVRLKETDAETVKEEIQRLSAKSTKKINNDTEQRSKVIIR